MGLVSASRSRAPQLSARRRTSPAGRCVAASQTCSLPALPSGASRIPATPKSVASARFRKRCVACIRRFSSRPVRTLELDVVDSAAAGLQTMGRTLMLQPPPMAKHEQLLLLVDLSPRQPNLLSRPECLQLFQPCLSSSLTSEMTALYSNLMLRKEHPDPLMLRGANARCRAPLGERTVAA